jgi:hypothetical protein
MAFKRELSSTGKAKALGAPWVVFRTVLFKANHAKLGSFVLLNGLKAQKPILLVRSMFFYK